MQGIRSSVLIRLFPTALALLCCVSVPLACSFGPLELTAADVFSLLAAHFGGVPLPETLSVYGPDGVARAVPVSTLATVLFDLRLPRALLALLSGAGLAVAGAAFQGILRNPLADPFTLGVSGGAAFGAALAISFGFTGALAGFALPVAAFAGAAAALAAVLALGRVGGGLRQENLVLAGVVVSAFLAALIALVKALDEASVTGIVFWIMGSFQGRGWTEAAIAAPGLLLGCGLMFPLARQLDMLSLGDAVSRHLGLSAARTRLALLLAAGAATASCVAVSGIIGFVGLIVPHLCRLLLGAEHKGVLRASALCGGLLLLWSDTAARTLLPGGVELPVGVITALFGGPFFCFLLGRRLRRPRGRAADAARAGGLRFAPEGGRTKASEMKPGRSASVPASLPQPPHIMCKGLHFAYGRAPSFPSVLDGLSFSLRAGEFVGLLGPNGSGKSTLLGCVSGLLSPGLGDVRVMGQRIDRLAEKGRARLLAVLPQRPESIPALPAFSLVLMGRYAHTPFLGGYSNSDVAMAWKALEATGAAHLAHRDADTLSGGELQRVLLARSLAQDAPLLLLDEAAAGLDPGCQTEVLDALARRNREQGLSVLAALHDLNLAALYCHRLIFLRQGRIVADGPTEEVFTPQLLRMVYDSEVSVVRHPERDRPQALLMPGWRH